MLPLPDLTNLIGVNLGLDWLKTSLTNYRVFEDYWRGVHSYRMLSPSELHDTELIRYWRVVNICQVVIEEPVGYLKNAPLTLDTEDDGLASWAAAWVNRYLKPRLGDLIRYQGVYGDAYAYFWTDYDGQQPGLKVQAIPPVEGGRRRLEADYEAEDPEELTRAVLYYYTPQFATPNLRQRALRLTADYIQQGQLYDDTARWDAPTPNPWGILPVANLKNAGASDLLQILNLQDDYNVEWFDLRQAFRYQANPLLASEDEPPPNLKVGPRQMVWGKGIQRLPPGDLSEMMNVEALTLERIALIARSRAVAQRVGGRIDMPAEGIRLLSEAFEAKLRDKADCIEDFIEDSLHLVCKMLARDKALYNLVRPQADGQPIPQATLEAASFECEITPRLPADENTRRTSIADAVTKGLYSQREGLRQSGFSEAQAQEVWEERQEEESQLQSGLPPSNSFGGGAADTGTALPPGFVLGARIRVKPARVHGPNASGVGTIAEINGTALGIIFDDMPEMGIHRWYVADEVDLLSGPGAAAPAQPGPGDAGNMNMSM